MEQENQTKEEKVVENKKEETKDLTFDEMLKDKDYQAEFDRRVQKAITTAKSKWEKDLDTKKESEKEFTNLEDELKKLKQQIADDKAKADAKAKDEDLTKDIIKTFKDKEFINEYTKKAIINEIKAEYNKEDNVKTLQDIFTSVTKDKEDIFVNPNQVKDIPNVSNTVFNNVDKEAFEKMGYKERVALKEENPELFKKLNN